MILLAFLLPFSIYLLLLGSVNRRRAPLLVPGTWDFVGITFAASGFLLTGGPALITSFSETWRVFWLFGRRTSAATSEELGSAGMFLAGLYFAVVVGGAAYLLLRRRNSTAVYNVASATLEDALARTFERLGIEPHRVGNVITLIHGKNAVLSIDLFEPLRHATLEWTPADSELRRDVEMELAHALEQTFSPPHPAGEWLSLIGMALIAFNLLGTFSLVLTNFLSR